MRAREPFSGFSHLVGAILALIGLPILIRMALINGDLRHLIAFAIFGVSLVLLYTGSALYHLLPLSPTGVLILRRIDHILIFVLIAGTYTPYCLIPLKGPWGWALLGVVWMITIGGVLMKLFWIDAPRWLSTLIYIFMGSLILVALSPLLQTLPLGGLVWLIVGGLFYLVGALVYGLKWPNFIPGRFGFHEIWHLFVLAGSFSHYWSVLRYVSMVV
ncbi:MAG: PAQR family membrane homeostasis protein TrhA [Limnochordia bacterium]|jgi:hemolysin III